MNNTMTKIDRSSRISHTTEAMFDFMSVVMVSCEGLGELVSLQSVGRENYFSDIVYL